MNDRHDDESGQGELFDPIRLPAVKPVTIGKKTTDEAFEEFHQANPHIFVAFVFMARRARRAGRDRIGIQMLAEVLRWDYTVNTNRPLDEFKINNNYLSRYARRIMEREPDLADIFQLRELRP